MSVIVGRLDKRIFSAPSKELQGQIQSVVPISILEDGSGGLED